MASGLQFQGMQLELSCLLAAPAHDAGSEVDVVPSTRGATRLASIPEDGTSTIELN